MNPPSPQSPAAKRAEELKPCPWCGCGLPKTHFYIHGKPTHHKIWCRDCPANMDFESSSKEQAIERWNKRRHFPKPPADEGLLPIAEKCEALISDGFDITNRKANLTVILSAINQAVSIHEKETAEKVQELVDGLWEVTKERDEARHEQNELAELNRNAVAGNEKLLSDKETLQKVALSLAAYGEKMNEHNDDFLHLISGHAQDCYCDRCKGWLNYKIALAAYTSLPESIRGKEQE